MKAIGRAAVLTLLGAGLVAAVAALGLSDSKGEPALAQGPITLAIDMDPYHSPANTCPGDGVSDCTVGSIDYCLSVPATEGTTFDVDAVVTGLWNGHAGSNWDFAFPDTSTGAKLTMIGQVEDNLLFNLIAQSPGSGPIISLSEPVPDPLGVFGSGGSPHAGAAADFGTWETTPPWTEGVLSRMTFRAGSGAVPGVYGFFFGSGANSVVDQSGDNYALITMDYNSSPQYGVLALGLPCPAQGTPTPTPPTPTPTATPPPTPPANDNFANAVRVNGLPFTHTVDSTAASSEPDEPHPCVDTATNPEWTVWYSFRPARDTYIEANSAGSNFAPIFAAYTGRSLNSLKLLTCDPYGTVGFVAKARTTYYLQATGRGQLVFNVTLAHDAAVTSLRVGGKFVRNHETKTQGVVVRNLGQTSGDEFDVGVIVWSEPGCTASIDDPQTPQREARNYITKRVSIGAKSQRTLWFRVTYACTVLSDPSIPEFLFDGFVMDIHGLDPNPYNNFTQAAQDMLTLGWGWHPRSGRARP